MLQKIRQADEGYKITWCNVYGCIFCALPTVLWQYVIFWKCQKKWKLKRTYEVRLMNLMYTMISRNLEINFRHFIAYPLFISVSMKAATLTTRLPWRCSPPQNHRTTAEMYIYEFYIILWFSLIFSSHAVVLQNMCITQKSNNLAIDKSHFFFLC